jgi:hypothetical protein
VTAHHGVPPQGPVTAHQNAPYPPRQRRRRSGQRWVLVVSCALATFGLLGGGFALLKASAGRADPASTTVSSQPASVQPSVPEVVASPEATAPTGVSTPIEVPAGETVLPTRIPRDIPTTPRTPRPRPTGTSSASSSASPRVVTPGAFCSPEGATGVTSAGTPMRCTLKAGEEQPRWRSAE